MLCHVCSILSSAGSSKLPVLQFGEQDVHPFRMKFLCFAFTDLCLPDLSTSHASPHVAGFLINGVCRCSGYHQATSSCHPSVPEEHYRTRSAVRLTCTIPLGDTDPTGTLLVSSPPCYNEPRNVLGLRCCSDKMFYTSVKVPCVATAIAHSHVPACAVKP